MNFETTPLGTMGKREAQILLKTDERTVVLELGIRGKFVAQIKRLRSKPGFSLRGDKLEVAVKNALVAHAPARATGWHNPRRCLGIQLVGMRLLFRLTNKINAATPDDAEGHVRKTPLDCAAVSHLTYPPPTGAG
jgi:hypothetical protein